MSAGAVIVAAASRLNDDFVIILSNAVDAVLENENPGITKALESILEATKRAILRNDELLVWAYRHGAVASTQSLQDAIERHALNHSEPKPNDDENEK